MGETIEDLVQKVLIMTEGNIQPQPTKIHLTITWRNWAVKTIPQVVSTWIIRNSMSQKTQIHYQRMIVMHRVLILVWTLLKIIFHATQEIIVRTALDNM
jgi:hypothetical protein